MVSDGFVLAFAERMAVVPDCCCQKRMASEETRVTREQLTFPVGEKIDNPAFEGEAFLRPMIALAAIVRDINLKQEFDYALLSGVQRMDGYNQRNRF